MVSYTHNTSCLRVINMFPFVLLLNHPRNSPTPPTSKEERIIAIFII